MATINGTKIIFEYDNPSAVVQKVQPNSTISVSGGSGCEPAFREALALRCALPKSIGDNVSPEYNSSFCSSEQRAAFVKMMKEKGYVLLTHSANKFQVSEHKSTASGKN